MQTARRVLVGRHFERAADVGAADGWYLRDLLDQGIVDEAVGVDVNWAMVEAGRRSSEGRPVRFFLPDDPTLLDQVGTFDLVTCLETLEHAEDPKSVLQQVAALAAPGAVLLVSVPIEVGPSLIGKQAGRWLANRRGGYSYEQYRWSELAKAALLWRTAHLTRQNLEGHKGFDYRVIAQDLARYASIQKTVYSPFTRLGPILASTVFWIARRR
jgi:2-polyprenyl-3-methyl-5-hydroxy-6-metoxy-1,4-benzoquinol methylase